MSVERLVVYGDFNCPYSALASARAARLEESGVEVDWRAVEHDAAMPPEGVEVAGKVRQALERELDEIRGVLTDDEEDHLGLPDHRPNTARVTAGYAAASPADRPDLRRALFAAVWQQGDPDRVAQIGSGDTESVTAAGWRRGMAGTTPTGRAHAGGGRRPRFARCGWPAPPGAPAARVRRARGRLKPGSPIGAVGQPLGLGLPHGRRGRPIDHRPELLGDLAVVGGGAAAGRGWRTARG